MDGLRAKKITKTKSKKRDPLVTKEAESFKKATSKITNYTNQYRLTEYLDGKKPSKQ